MSHPLSRHTVSFVVRLWAEYMGEDPPTWRGEIESVGSDEVVRFGDLQQVVQVIERWARELLWEASQQDAHEGE